MKRSFIHPVPAEKTAMKNRFQLVLILAILSLAVSREAAAQPSGFNYDESKVPQYRLPDPLKGVKTSADWKKRRQEILSLFQQQMFGMAPKFDASKLRVSASAAEILVLGGKAKMTQPVLHLPGADVQLLIFVPAKSNEPVPVFLGCNFEGNHTVLADSRIELPKGWIRGAKDNKADDSQRGKKSSRWAIEKIIDRGYGLITVYYGHIDPDFDDGFRNGVYSHFGQPKPNEWGSIAAWAWGLSRVLDYLEATPATGIDAERVAVMGHSRLGKTSLWAGASDERFAMVISNDSGCGGAALSRRAFGETVARINTSFPHWFCGNFKRYNGKESELPFDQHMLIALMAPRPVYVASAEGDRWADPHGEFLSAKGADPVYRLLGTEGLPAKTMPAVDQPVQGQIGYHMRSGKHDVTDFDWGQYLNFADRHLRKK